MADLLGRAELPPHFAYPMEFLRVVDLGLTKLEPWWIIEGELLRDRHRGINHRYPTRDVVVFAVRQDRDDVACFDTESDRVFVIRNPVTGEAEDQSPWLQLDHEYDVLEVTAYPGGRVDLRLVSEDAATPALFDAALFMTVDSRVPTMWEARLEEGGVLMAHLSGWRSGSGRLTSIGSRRL